MLKRDSPAEAV